MTELVDLQAELVQLHQNGIVVSEKGGDVFGPGISTKLLIDLILQLDEGKIDLSFHGSFAEQPGAERVDGADEAMFDVPQGFRQALAGDAVRGSYHTLQLDLKAIAQLGGGLAGERHGGQ